MERIIHEQVFKQKIVNSIHSSQESLKYPNARTSMKSRNSQNESIATTELVSLNSTSKLMLPSGK
jgi:hypothetical protein